VIPFYGKDNEWPVWSKKFLAKSKKDGFKDLLFGIFSILKKDEKFDEILDIGKTMARTIKLNEIAYT
jgi:hypothetical protein